MLDDIIALPDEMKKYVCGLRLRSNLTKQMVLLIKSHSFFFFTTKLRKKKRNIVLYERSLSQRCKLKSVLTSACTCEDSVNQRALWVVSFSPQSPRSGGKCQGSGRRVRTDTLWKHIVSLTVINGTQSDCTSFLNPVFVLLGYFFFS